MAMKVNVREKATGSVRVEGFGSVKSFPERSAEQRIRRGRAATDASQRSVRRVVY